jgi:hypothetical protein
VSAAGAFRVSGSILAGIGVRYLGRSGLVERDETGTETGEYSFSSGIASIGASSSLGRNWSAGISLGIAWEDAGEQGATGFTTSAGLRGEISDGLILGAVIRGFGLAPEWNGIHKDMPTEIAASVVYSISETVSAFGGGRYGFDTPDSWCLGAELGISGFSVSGGYDIYPDADECTGFFGGLGYTYDAGEVYSVELAICQRDVFDWPVLAGLSVLF